MRVLLRWAVGAGALYLTVLLGQQVLGKDQLALKDPLAAFLVVAVLTLVNALVRPLVKLFAMPLNCLTLGLFNFVINALMFWLVGSLDLGLRVRGFVPALFGSVVLSVVSGLLNSFLVDKDDKR